MRDSQRVLREAGPVDVAGATPALDALAADLARWDHTLRGAAAWPLTLAFSVSLCGAIVSGVGLPAIAALPAGPSVPVTPVLAGSIASAVLLLVLAQLVWWRTRVPGLADGWRRLDGYALVEGARALMAAGVDLPAALRAASVWCGDPGAAVRLARGLEAGGAAVDGAPLLSPFEVGVLVSGARAGLALPTLDALATTRRAALARDIPREAARVHVIGLCLAGLGLVCVGGTWSWAYSAAVAG